MGVEVCLCLCEQKSVQFASEFVFAQDIQLIVPNFCYPAKEPRNILYAFKGMIKKKFFLIKKATM